MTNKFHKERTIYSSTKKLHKIHKLSFLLAVRKFTETMAFHEKSNWGGGGVKLRNEHFQSNYASKFKYPFTILGSGSLPIPCGSCQFS